MNEPWVVWSFEHDSWWAPGWRGYVLDLNEAGRYSKADALEIEHDANVVSINERAVSLAKAERYGPPKKPRM